MKHKLLSAALNIVIFIVLAGALISAIGTAVKQEPFLLTSVYSNSMYPEFRRGDILFLRSLGENDNPAPGDIVVFRAQEGSLASRGWIVHRIVGGDAQGGYYTRGDANELRDQDAGGNVPVRREWITSRVLTLGGRAVKLPLAGYLTLWMEDLSKSPYMIPAVVVLLALVIGVGDGKRRKKKKAGAKPAGGFLLFFLCGLTLSAMLGVSMLMLSQEIILVYEVSDRCGGVIVGSEVGVMAPGEIVEKSLAELKNEGIIPVTAIVTTRDPQIDVSPRDRILRPGENIDVAVSVQAQSVGEYRSRVHVGLYYPFLPTHWLHRAASVHFILAIVLVAVIPGLPIMLYPLFDARLRMALVRRFRQIRRRLCRG